MPGDAGRYVPSFIHHGGVIRLDNSSLQFSVTNTSWLDPAGRHNLNLPDLYHRYNSGYYPNLKRGCRNVIAGNTGATDEPRRGRPRTRRRMAHDAPPRCYSPQCNLSGTEEVVTVLPEELEVLKLVDLLGYEQEEAAVLLGVSRRTAWRDLHEVRRKIADALVHGKGIEIAGCLVRNEGNCPKMRTDQCPRSEGGICPRHGQTRSRTEGFPDYGDPLV